MLAIGLHQLSGPRLPVNASANNLTGRGISQLADRLKMRSLLLLLFVGGATGKLLAERDIMDANCYHRA